VGSGEGEDYEYYLEKGREFLAPFLGGQGGRHPEAVGAVKKTIAASESLSVGDARKVEIALVEERWFSEGHRKELSKF
jgi:hypothetical protein